jgi:hypothetical protein
MRYLHHAPHVEDARVPVAHGRAGLIHVRHGAQAGALPAVVADPWVAMGGEERAVGERAEHSLHEMTLTTTNALAVRAPPNGSYDGAAVPARRAAAGRRRWSIRSEIRVHQRGSLRGGSAVSPRLLKWRSSRAALRPRPARSCCTDGDDLIHRHEEMAHPITLSLVHRVPSPSVERLSRKLASGEAEAWGCLSCQDA